MRCRAQDRTHDLNFKMHSVGTLAPICSPCRTRAQLECTDVCAQGPEVGASLEYANRSQGSEVACGEFRSVIGSLGLPTG